MRHRGVTILLQKARHRGPDEVGPEQVEEIYGIEPSQVPDFIALRGDPSDGLPGAKGIGAKTAADMLRRKGDWSTRSSARSARSRRCARR